MRKLGMLTAALLLGAIGTAQAMSGSSVHRGAAGANPYALTFVTNDNDGVLYCTSTRDPDHADVLSILGESDSMNALGASLLVYFNAWSPPSNTVYPNGPRHPEDCGGNAYVWRVRTYP